MVTRGRLNKVHTAFGPTPYSDHTVYMHIMAGMSTVGATTFNVIMCSQHGISVFFYFAKPQPSLCSDYVHDLYP